MSTLTEAQIAALKAALDDAKPPYCCGTLPVDPRNLILFYGKADGAARRIDCSNASVDALEHLTQTCDPATFGRNQDDVLDESYRKAGKLDNTHFAINFDLEAAGLIDAIRFGLLEGVEGQRSIHAELYKLNVYGEGSFFKAHKDTPRGEAMFGSLVVAFPTHYEGGALTLRADGKEWTFDSGKAITAQSGPCVAYAAFYSDVEHEVTVVESGYRITITYNLYFNTKDEITSVPATVQGLPPNEAAFKAAFSTMLADPTFLSKGGYLGFSLFHQYPIESGGRTRYNLEAGNTALKRVADCLKGRDAMILKICKDLSLSANLKFFFCEDGDEILTDQYNFEGDYMESSFIHYLWDGRDCNAKLISAGESYMNDKVNFKVHWIMQDEKLNGVKSSVIVYGNEAELGHVYGRMCLIVQVGPYGGRGILGV